MYPAFQPGGAETPPFLFTAAIEAEHQSDDHGQNDHGEYDERCQGGQQGFGKYRAQDQADGQEKHDTQKADGAAAAGGNNALAQVTGIAIIHKEPSFPFPLSSYAGGRERCGGFLDDCAQLKMKNLNLERMTV